MLPVWASRETLEKSRQHERHCMLCEHRCGVARGAGELGVCKADGVARVFKQRVEYGEEKQLSPSHLFYLSGCDLRCAFCIAEANAFNPKLGVELTAEFLRNALASGKASQPRTLQWVGGEPTIHLPAIFEAMAGCSDLPPVVWKSDFHGTPEAFALLDGVVSVYLADFKFGNNACARRIAGVERYLETVTRNLLLAERQGQLIVRHLLLPGHEKCCYEPIVTWLAEHLPGAMFSVRDCYLPRWRARQFPELSVPLPPGAAEPALRLAKRRGLQLVS